MLMNIFTPTINFLKSASLSPFHQIASVVNKSLNKHFPPKRNVRIISEPGCYFVASAFSLTVNVIAKRSVTQHADKGEIYTLKMRV